MGRYRPPAKPKSPYVTAEGFAALKSELDERWQLRREVVQALAAAAAEGDRSENAEYIYRKKQLREIDRRIAYLQKRLPQLKVVSSPPENTRQVFFGAYVTVEDESGVTSRYRIVGPDEFDMQDEFISLDSPVARALMKKQLDDEVLIRTPGGERYILITAISYQSPG